VPPSGCIAGQFSCSHYIPVLLLLKPTLPYRDAHPIFMGLIERNSEMKQVADILDRIIDKGIVVDASTRLFLMNTRIKSSGTRVQVAPLDTPAPPSRNERWYEVQRKRRAA